MELLKQNGAQKKVTEREVSHRWTLSPPVDITAHGHSLACFAMHTSEEQCVVNVVCTVLMCLQCCMYCINVSSMLYVLINVSSMLYVLY